MIRGLLALLVIAGVALCTRADVNTLPPPAVVDGFHVLAADFHVHAAFGDGGLTPWDARREAARHGLHVIAITNHNQTYAPRVHRALFGQAGFPILLAGEEVTAPSHHILAVGVSSPVYWRQTAAETIRDIQSRGGVAIAAHPQGDSMAGYDDEALAALDAAERAHPGMHRTPETEEGFEEFFRRARAHNPKVAPVGDSDFHFNGRIGLAHTYVLAREPTEVGVLEALRAGRSVAFDLYGRAYGEARLVRTVQMARRLTGTRTPPWARWTNVAGAALVWSGLLALVLSGPRRTATPGRAPAASPPV